MNRKSMIALLCCLAVTGLAQFGSAEEPLARISPEQLLPESQPLPPGIQVTRLEGGVVRVENPSTEALSVVLTEVPLSALGECTLVYRAQLRAIDLAGYALLEMWCVYPGGDRYFSRAVNQPVSLTSEFRDTETPFLIDAKQHPEKALLGVVIQGPGAVELRDMTLWKVDRTAAGRNAAGEITPQTALLMEQQRAGMIWGIAGSVLGVVSGLWSVVAVLLAWRGRARGLVLGVFWGYLLLGIGLASWGALAYAQTLEFWRAFPALLLGHISLIVGITGQVVFRARYRAAEEQRMNAMDLPELHD